jgi:hypothetical protein
MKSLIITTVYIVILLAGLSETKLLAKPQDVYLVIYITKTGYTGHVGIAVDNYKVIARDTVISGVKTVAYDSVKNQSLTYFDLWGPPTIGLDEHDKNLSSRYYKLPRSSSEETLTPDYFLTKGLPHSYDYPCDALIRIETSAAADYKMKDIAEEIQRERPYFNSRSYNCTDYVVLCLNRLFNLDIKAKEYIPFTWSTTPNKFYRIVVSSLEVDIIKDPGSEVNQSFFRERVVNTVLYNQFINHEKNN